MLKNNYVFLIRLTFTIDPMRPYSQKFLAVFFIFFPHWNLYNFIRVFASSLLHPLISFDLEQFSSVLVLLNFKDGDLKGVLHRFYYVYQPPLPQSATRFLIFR